MDEHGKVHNCDRKCFPAEIGGEKIAEMHIYKK